MLRPRLVGRRPEVRGRTLEIHDVRGDLDAPDSVGERVVHLHHERAATFGQALQECELPERSVMVEGSHAGVPGEGQHGRHPARLSDANPPDMPAQIEVRVHDPTRWGKSPRAGDELLAKRRGQARGPIDPIVEDSPIRGAVVHRHRHDRRAQQRVALELHRERIDLADMGFARVAHRLHSLSAPRLQSLGTPWWDEKRRRSCHGPDPSAATSCASSPRRGGAVREWRRAVFDGSHRGERNTALQRAEHRPTGGRRRVSSRRV